ncbi:MAG: hypothetical protein J7641_18695 [Cyanobacteria bacterium SID2]|nr:hypothetical protein [Cyanobacteria bacterium SID2]MBP0005289.1 hypothetical protein [Cyanobacteria bacterium SBC]
MNEASQLIYPTFTLFLYDLREELGQDADKVRQNSHRFWRKVEPVLDRDYDALDDAALQKLDRLTAVEKPEAIAVELFAELSDDALEGRRSLGDDLDGYFYALQLGDIYALQVNYAGKRQTAAQLEYAAKSLDRVPELQKDLLTFLNHNDCQSDLDLEKQGSIGQTWLLWAKLPGNHPESSQVARACRRQLIPEGQWDKVKPVQGRFVGANLYEVWQAPTDWAHPSRENQHLIVLLFPPRLSVESVRTTMDAIYPHLIRLFCYRNKIVWAYSRSRALKRQLKADYIAIETTMDNLSVQIGDRPLSLDLVRSQLADTLTLASRYVHHLNDLDHQARIIRSNLANYTNQIKKISELDPDSQLGVFSEFADGPAETYRLQIETDRARFEVGSALLKNIISTLRGAIEIQQVTPDRDLTPSIVSVGVGVATTQAVGLAWLARSKPSESSVSPFFGLLLSLVAGVVSAFVVWKLYRSRSHS